VVVSVNLVLAINLDTDVGDWPERAAEPTIDYVTNADSTWLLNQQCLPFDAPVQLTAYDYAWRLARREWGTTKENHVSVLKKILVVAVATFGMATASFAQERANKEEAKSLAQQAAVHVKQVGPEQAFKDFNDKASTKWKHKDLYVFAYNMKGDCLANGANEQLVGRNQIELKDPSGKPIVQEMISVAAKGDGSVDYSWPHPQTKKVEGKTSYVIKLANYEGFVGVGVYR